MANQVEDTRHDKCPPHHIHLPDQLAGCRFLEEEQGSLYYQPGPKQCNIEGNPSYLPYILHSWIPQIG